MPSASTSVEIFAPVSRRIAEAVHGRQFVQHKRVVFAGNAEVAKRSLGAHTSAVRCIRQQLSQVL